MRVSELITELQKLDQDLPVVVRGMYSGYEDALDVSVCTVYEYPELSWTHDKYAQYQAKDTKPVTAVFID